MIVVTHRTLRNPAILKVRQLPRKFFGRVTVWPRTRVGFWLYLRLIIEFQALRYALTLLPLILIGLSWNAMALPMAQAPILMVAMIWLVEMRLLRVPKARRARLIDAAAADRGLDLLRLQARAALTRIAAGRDMKRGELHLVIEQSELWRLPPLTYVSVQSEDGPKVIALSVEECAILREELFKAPLSERLLQRINQSQGVFLRDVTFDARGVSAHARLAAALG
ncbi:hypothetical protein KDD17_01270 [Sulfitobacter albidus]|uniref:Uncharacterized protein n=2 Tax=Sulfitobacter albidus TaxID=2829501 RepID=A0A975JG57_9RHOB|nr:hypothetical protein KDD17_01270 [Sulfitobacter albidus]